MIKKILFVLTIIISLVIIIGSLSPLKTISPLTFNFSDKLLHVGAYTVLSVMWNILLTKPPFKFSYLTVISLISLGWILELLQGWLPINRTTDYVDLGYNIMGVLLGTLVSIKIKKFVSRLL